MSGAAPLPRELAERFERLTGARPVEGYGLSETAPVSHANPMSRPRYGSIGLPMPDTLCRVVDLDDGTHDVPTGQPGELLVAGPQIMSGYYRNAEATAAASAYGWHHTGDIGYLDAENYLYIVDRAKDMIITGGFNVYSTEVEQALMAHAAVQDCAVIGQPDEKWGERVVAVVQLQPGASVDAAELIAFAKARIGSVKAPKEVLVWPDLPRSKVGKVVKPDIKARLAATG